MVSDAMTVGNKKANIICEKFNTVQIQKTMNTRNIFGVLRGKSQSDERRENRELYLNTLK